MQVDVLIIGSGMAGTLAALTAHRRGASVAVSTRSWGATALSTGALDLAYTPALGRVHQVAGDFAGMAELITDEVLSVFAVEAPWSELPATLVDRYGELADRLVLYVAGFAWGRPDGAFERFGGVARAVRELSGQG